jgi:hypothetical protein
MTTSYRLQVQHAACSMALYRDRTSLDVVESCMCPRISHKVASASPMMHVPGKMIDRKYGDDVFCKTPL